MKIYVVGRIQDDHANVVMYNLGRLIFAASEIWAMGHQPFCPAWVAMQGMMSGRPISYKEYFDLGAAFLPDCGAVYCVDGWGGSVGANKERKIAEKFSIPIFEDMSELIRFANESDGIKSLSGISVVVNEDLDDGTWAWSEDIRATKPILMVAKDVANTLIDADGVSPPQLLKEMKERTRNA